MHVHVSVRGRGVMFTKYIAVYFSNLVRRKRILLGTVRGRYCTPGQALIRGAGGRIGGRIRGEWDLDGWAGFGR